MNILLVLLAVLFLTLIGYMLIRVLNLYSDKRILEIWGMSYGLGVGIVAMQLYVFSRLHIKWDIQLLIVVWVTLLILFLQKSLSKISLQIQTVNKKNIHIVLIFAICCVVGYVFFEAILRPLSVWDGWAIWLLKAKIFFIDGQINAEVLNYVHSGYPLVISLLGTFLYIVLGRVDDTAVLVGFFAFYVFLGIFFFAVLKEKFGIGYALFWTFLLLSIQTLIRQGGRYEVGQADLALGYYFLISTFLLLEYRKTHQLSSLILLQVFLAISALVKSDAIPFIGIVEVFIVFEVIKRKLYKHILTIFIWVIPLFEWQWYLITNGVMYKYGAISIFSFSFQKTIHVAQLVIKEFMNISSWHVLWIMYFYSLFLGFFKKNGEIFILHTVIISQIIVYILLYISVVGYTPQSSFARLLVHVAPITVYLLAVVTAEHINFDKILQFINIPYTLNKWKIQLKKKKK